MEQYIAANQSPGQYGLVIDQNLSQRYTPVNNSSKVFPYFVSGGGGNQSAPLNLLPSNSFYSTNQLNSSLNGKNVGLNTQDKKKRSNYHPAAHLNSSFPNSWIDQHMGNEMLNAHISLMHPDLNSTPLSSLTYMNHFEKQQAQNFKSNHIPFVTNNLSNNNSNESHNGHPFIHPQLQQQQQQQQQQLLSNSNNKNNSSTLNNIQSTQMSKSYPIQSSQMHSTYLHHLDKDKQLPVNLYFNSSINLNNKRPKLNTENKSYNPLMIDTMLLDFKKDGVYNPQVEAISPTNLEDRNSEQNAFKNQILQSLEKLDREIKQKESRISKFKKQQKELEALTNSTTQNQTDNLDPNDLKQLSTTQQVYTENKQKANVSQKKLDNIRPLTIANKNKFKWFKSRLVAYFRRRLLHKQKRENYLTTTYEKLMSDWLKSVESKANGMKKSKELKTREYFEKQFPDLKRAREEKLNKAKGKTDETGVIDYQSGLENEQEYEMKRMRSLAVIPPILLDSKLKKYNFFNTNGLILDPVSEYKELQYLNIWRDAEREIFKEKFILSPKNFTLIASFLDNKTVMDCVQFYYSSKKKENYKQLLRKNAKKRTRALVKQQALAEQKAKQQELELQKEMMMNKAVNGINLSTKSESTDDSTNTELKDKSNKSPSNEQEIIKGKNLDEPSINCRDNSKQDSKENLDKSIEINNNILRCNLCNQEIENVTKSYVITRLNYQLFNMNPEDLQPDYRICLPCKARYLKGPCPVTSCKFFNSETPVRLKPLPIEWFELSPEQRYTYSAELNFPVDCKHCCSRCWILLIRKYGHLLKYPIDRYLSCTWKLNEIDAFKKLLCQHGRNYSFIASQLNKTIKQCKDFYFYYKYQMKLPEIAQMAAYQSNKLLNRDSDSDDYFENDFKDVESDSESFDDLRLARRNSKSRRTNSFIGADGLLSLSKRHSSSNLSLKSDCDSCATLSADEEGDLNADIRRAETNSILMNQQRVPAFLINPNAPTTNIPNWNHSTNARS